jgi:hypothetical protein
MDMEEEMEVFGKTALWDECDLCGRVFGGPGLSKAIVPVGNVHTCGDRLRKIADAGKVM